VLEASTQKNYLHTARDKHQWPRGAGHSMAGADRDLRPKHTTDAVERLNQC